MRSFVATLLLRIGLAAPMKRVEIIREAGPFVSESTIGKRCLLLYSIKTDIKREEDGEVAE